MNTELEQFAPLFKPDMYTPEEKEYLQPFFTNLDKSVYAPLIFAPELIGALCSRTSRAPEDLRRIFLNEYVIPFLNPIRDEKDTDETWQEKQSYSKHLAAFLAFLKDHPVLEIFSNPRARSFYIKWLAQYGDDSIAQMAGAHLVFWGISQIAIKHFEDQRIGLAPIEKSTRYVNYAKKVNGSYLYYTDPTLRPMGMEKEYQDAMDTLFDTYAELIPKLIQWLTKKFPEEKPSVIEKKAFDTLRGLLPSSTLSQVAFFGNGQAFEYMVNRSLKHHLGEIRWAGERTYEELFEITPAFLRRVKDKEHGPMIDEYQTYLAQKRERVAPFIEKYLADKNAAITPEQTPSVHLIEYDAHGEEKIIASMLFTASGNHWSWEETLDAVKRMHEKEKQEIVSLYLKNRNARWQKIGRAFENAYARFEIVMNIGAWRDLHRHRMLTQERQLFTVTHGFDVPRELVDAGLDTPFKNAIEKTEKVFRDIEKQDPILAQYATTLAHRVRFMQWENLRQSFWQIELRTIPEGHPDYRKICQEKFWLLKKTYPILMKEMLVNLGEYDFARRGQEEKIQKKIQQLS